MAVSDHVFHRFPFDLLIQLFATQLSLFSCIPFVLMAAGRAGEDALHTSLPGSPPLSSNVGSPPGSGHDLDGMGTCSGNTLDEKLDALLSKFVHFEAQIAQIPAPTTWIHISRKHLEITRVDLQRSNRISVPSLHVCANSRHMLPQHQMFPDPGLNSNTLTAPQPHGPMAQGHLMTIETHDEDLILPQAQKMNNHEVPSFSDSLVYGRSQSRSYSNHSQDTGCTIMDDFMTKANDLFPTQTRIENLTLQPNGLNAQRVRATPCMCHTRGQEPRPHKEFTTACNFHLISNTL